MTEAHDTKSNIFCTDKPQAEGNTWLRSGLFVKLWWQQDQQSASHRETQEAASYCHEVKPAFQKLQGMYVKTTLKLHKLYMPCPDRLQPGLQATESGVPTLQATESDVLNLGISTGCTASVVYWTHSADLTAQELWHVLSEQVFCRCVS